MTTHKNRILHLFLLFFSAILFSCSAIKEPVFTGIDKVEPGGIGMKQTMVLLHLKCFNPNRFGLYLKNAEGDAWIEDSFLGHFKMDSSMKIHGRSEFTVPVRLNVDMKSALKNASTILFKPEVNFKITGKAKIRKGGVAIDYPIRYEGKQDLSKLLQ